MCGLQLNYDRDNTTYTFCNPFCQAYHNTVVKILKILYKDQTKVYLLL